MDVARNLYPEYPEPDPVKRYLEYKDNFPSLPVVRVDGVESLAQHCFSQEDIEELKNFNGKTEIEITVMKYTMYYVLIPLSQTRQHAQQRKIEPHMVKLISASFGVDPTRHMIKGAGLLLAANAENWPALPTGGTPHSIYVVVDPRLIGAVYDGGHRGGGMGVWSDTFRVPEGQAYWIYRVLHPDFSNASSEFLGAIMLSANKQHDQLRSSAATELTTVLRYGQKVYAAHREARKQQIVVNTSAGASADERKDYVFMEYPPALINDYTLKQSVGAITTKYKLMCWILGTEDIVNAVLSTKLLEESELWARNPTDQFPLVFIGVLERLRVLILATRIIHAAKKTSDLLSAKIGRDFEYRDFFGVDDPRTKSDATIMQTGTCEAITKLYSTKRHLKPSISETDLLAIVEQVAKEYRVPVFLYIPDIIKSESGVFRTTLNSVFDTLAALVYLVGGYEVSRALRFPGGTPQYPLSDATVPLHVLSMVLLRKNPKFSFDENALIDYIVTKGPRELSAMWRDCIAAASTAAKVSNDVSLKYLKEDRQSHHLGVAIVSLLTERQEWYDLVAYVDLRPGSSLSHIGASPMFEIPKQSPHARKAAEYAEAQRLAKSEEIRKMELRRNQLDESRSSIDGLAKLKNTRNSQAEDDTSRAAERIQEELDKVEQQAEAAKEKAKAARESLAAAKEALEEDEQSLFAQEIDENLLQDRLKQLNDRLKGTNDGLRNATKHSEQTLQKQSKRSEKLDNDVIALDREIEKLKNIPIPPYVLPPAPPIILDDADKNSDYMSDNMTHDVINCDILEEASIPSGPILAFTSYYLSLSGNEQDRLNDPGFIDFLKTFNSARMATKRPSVPHAKRARSKSSTPKKGTKKTRLDDVDASTNDESNDSTHASGDPIDIDGAILSTLESPEANRTPQNPQLRHRKKAQLRPKPSTIPENPLFPGSDSDDGDSSESDTRTQVTRAATASRRKNRQLSSSSSSSSTSSESDEPAASAAVKNLATVLNSAIAKNISSGSAP